MIKLCEYDKKEFKTSHARVKYCSQDCANKAKTKARATFICKNCKKTYPQKSPSKIPIYCSQDCRNADMGVKTKKCVFCDKEYTPTHKTNKYCSPECFNIARLKKRIEGDCEQCGKHYTSKYTVNNYAYTHGQIRRFCSKDCQLEHQRKEKIKVTCLQDGVEFEVFPSELENGRGRFCSLKCRGMYYSGEKSSRWKGGISSTNALLRKGAGKSAWRNAVLSRDGFKCIWCDSREDLEVDHIKPWGLFPELRNDVSNGRTLCHSCHIGTITYGARMDKFTRADFEEGGKLEDY